MFDAAQVLRHSIQPNRLESLQAYAPAEAASTQAAERGELMGTQFVVESDPLAELQDSMEELSFQFEEKSAKKLADRKLGETRNRRSAYVQALEGGRRRSRTCQTTSSSRGSCGNCAQPWGKAPCQMCAGC